VRLVVEQPGYGVELAAEGVVEYGVHVPLAVRAARSASYTAGRFFLCLRYHERTAALRGVLIRITRLSDEPANDIARGTKGGRSIVPLRPAVIFW
jgi:hypothetical protein